MASTDSMALLHLLKHDLLSIHSESLQLAKFTLSKILSSPTSLVLNNDRTLYLLLACRGLASNILASSLGPWMIENLSYTVTQNNEFPEKQSADHDLNNISKAAARLITLTVVDLVEAGEFHAAARLISKIFKIPSQITLNLRAGVNILKGFLKRYIAGNGDVIRINILFDDAVSLKYNVALWNTMQILLDSRGTWDAIEKNMVVDALRRIDMLCSSQTY